MCLSQTQYTPLHIAAQWNSTEVAALLLDAKANPNLKTKDGRTALHMAAWKDSIDVATLLCERGAKKNLKSENGDMALDIAIRANAGNVVSLLREKGARSKNDPPPSAEKMAVKKEAHKAKAAVAAEDLAATKLADSKETEDLRRLLESGESTWPLLSVSVGADFAPTFRS